LIFEKVCADDGHIDKVISVRKKYNIQKYINVKC